MHYSLEYDTKFELTPDQCLVVAFNPERWAVFKKGSLEVKMLLGKYSKLANGPKLNQFILGNDYAHLQNHKSFSWSFIYVCKYI